jgi:hypothetical protein
MCLNVWLCSLAKLAAAQACFNSFPANPLWRGYAAEVAYNLWLEALLQEYSSAAGMAGLTQVLIKGQHVMLTAVADIVTRAVQTHEGDMRLTAVFVPTNHVSVML